MEGPGPAVATASEGLFDVSRDGKRVLYARPDAGPRQLGFGARPAFAIDGRAGDDVTAELVEGSR